ncbi:hypothetical protein ACB092_12G219500 [Castanea dentata]
MIIAFLPFLLDQEGGSTFLALKKDIGVATLAYKAEALELQKQLRHIQSQFDMHTGQASSLIQGRRARVAATSTVNGHLTDLDDSLSARNLELKLKMKLMIPVLWLQFGCLHAISTVLESVSRLPQLFLQVEPTLVPIMRRMLTSDGQVSYF